MNTCATDDDKIKTSPTDSVYNPEIGDIVIINVNGYLKKRHIFNIRDQMSAVHQAGNNLIIKKVYDVDYGLGLTKEGSITRSQIIRKATEDDKLIIL